MLYQSLKELANKEKDEFSIDIDGNSALAQALEAKKKKDQERVQEEMLALLRKMQERKDRIIYTIREYRKLVAAEKANLNKIDRAYQYGAETDDFLPLIQLVDLGGVDWAEKHEVPKSWSPKE